MGDSDRSVERNPAGLPRQSDCVGVGGEHFNLQAVEAGDCILSLLLNTYESGCGFKLTNDKGVWKVTSVCSMYEK